MQIIGGALRVNTHHQLLLYLSMNVGAQSLLRISKMLFEYMSGETGTSLTQYFLFIYKKFSCFGIKKVLKT